MTYQAGDRIIYMHRKPSGEDVGLQFAGTFLRYRSVGEDVVILSLDVRGPGDTYTALVDRISRAYSLASHDLEDIS